MRKTILSFIALASVLAFAVPASAVSPNWDVTGSYTVSFELGGSYLHDMVLTQDSLGNVTGSGGYLSGNPYTFAWVVISGTVDGNNINLTADYTLGAVGTTMHMSGVIASGGTMSGVWDDNYGGGTRNGTWSTTSGYATEVTNTTIVVSPADMQGWGFMQESPDAPGSGVMVTGPSTPPLGVGSANLVVSVSEGQLIGKLGYSGTKLSDITDLEYRTYRTAGAPAVAIALQFNIDNDVTYGDNAWKGRLVYEPYFTQTVNTGVWETWNPMNDSAGTGTGNWWGTGAAISAVCPQANPCTWSELLAAFPNAGVHNLFGAVLLKVGSGSGAFDGNVDALTVGVNWENITYDFEPDTDGDGIVDGTDNCLEVANSDQADADNDGIGDVCDADSDNDGVEGDADFCPGTGNDSPDETLGVNRHVLVGDVFMTLIPGAKGAKVSTSSPFTLEQTHGCSCEQILNELVEETGLDFDGHYKYGCSKSVIEDGIAGTYHVGPTLRDTVTVDSALIGGANSTWVLEDEKDYFLKASGTWNNRGWEWVDAKYTTGDNWGTYPDAPAGGYLPELLDLQVNNLFENWGAFDSGHTYQIPFSPVSDGVVNFRVFDGDVPTNTPDAGWYGDNIGSLTVEILEDLWVDLW